MKKTSKQFFSVLLAAFMFVISVASIGTPTEVRAGAVEPQSGNIYYIKNKNSGMYLTVANDSKSNGANVIQSKGTGSLGQRWILEKNQKGSYRLHPATDMTGRVSLDVAGGSNAGGTNIQIWSNNGYEAQNFKFASVGNNGYVITTGTSAYNSCLDVTNYSTASGANVIQWTNKSTDNQIWYFEQAPWPSSNSNNDNGNSNSGNTSNTSESTVNVTTDTSYVTQKIQFINTNNKGMITAPTGTGNVSANVKSSKYNQWTLVNDGSNKYMIVNAKTGYVLAPVNNKAVNGAKVVATGKTGASSQYWTISSVSNDANGDGYMYKISNCGDSNLSIIMSGSEFVLGKYSGSSTHKFFVNSYGVEGFAGMSKSVNGREKGSVTGGVFGKTVYVSDFNGLSNYCAGTTPYTIVLTSNISKSALTKINVGKNKTIIGSFNANTLNNVHFRCISNSGNVIFKNITFKHDSNKNANDDIQVYISDGHNFWVDHCTFPGHSSLTSNDVDKLMYVGLKADFVSVTGCVFMNHKYGLILGYPQEDGMNTYKGYPQMTICNNYFSGVLTRAPGLMRYGYFHCYNNFVYDFNLGYTPYTGCNIYSENNYFDKGYHTGAVVDDHGVGGFVDSGSVLSWNLSNIRTGKTSFRPSSCYVYNTRNANDAKAWAQKGTGVQRGAIAYAID